MYTSRINKPKKEYGKLSDYTGKELYSLVKPHSPKLIKFFEEPTDSWFIHVITYRRNGTIVDTSYIIKPDVETWLSMLTTEGYMNILNSKK
jgi:hypothetical protein